MSTDHEATIRSFFDVWVDRDPVRLTQFFADDGSWSEANRPGAVGHQAIQEVFEMQTGFGSDFSFEFRNLVVVGDIAFTERVDHFSLNDTPMTVPVAGVFDSPPTDGSRPGATTTTGPISSVSSWPPGWT